MTEIYTRDEAAKIIEMFESILAEHDVRIPSPEDDEREEDNMIGLYGSTYYDLLDDVENTLIDLLKRTEQERCVIPLRFSGNC